MTEDYGCHQHSTLIIGVKVGQIILDNAVLHYAEGGENHRETECYQAEAADGGDELVSAAYSTG